MPRRTIRVAIVYDFDGTLAPGNMQEQSFLPAVRASGREFWREAKSRAKRHDMDEILAYMELMLERSRKSDIKSTRQAFRTYGRRIKFFPGVPTWFGRINRTARRLNCAIAHFVVSSGNRETIEGTTIAKHLTEVFASTFRYDANDVAVWPALAVNYTNKAQYLFRINKGIRNSHDNSTINRYTPEEQRPYPFKNFIYIGDGETDVPAMKMVTYQGGKSIAVFPPRKHGARRRAHDLVHQQRADIAVPADYSRGSALETAVRAAIRQIAARHEFERCDSSPLKGLRPPK